jgi:hypothetical protein
VGWAQPGPGDGPAPGSGGRRRGRLPGSRSRTLRVRGEPLVWNVPSSPPGYLTFRARVVDRAGNRSDPLEARVLRDVLPPQVTPPPSPGPWRGGRSGPSPPRPRMTWTSTWAGGNSLRRWGGADPPLRCSGHPGPPFSGDLVTEAGFSVRFPFVKGVESAPGGVPDGTFDPRWPWWPRRWMRPEIGPWPAPPFRSGAFLLRGFGPEARGDDGVRRWELEASAQEVCREDGECGDGVPGALDPHGPGTGAGRRLLPSLRGRAPPGGGGRGPSLDGDRDGGGGGEVGSGAEGREWRWESGVDPTPGSSLRFRPAGDGGGGRRGDGPPLRS